MATIREYFDTDARTLTVHKTWVVQTSADATVAEVVAKIAYDFEANAKYWYFFVPAMPNWMDLISTLLASPQVAGCQLGEEGDGALVEIGIGDYSERQSSRTLQFTRRAHLYLDVDLSLVERRSVVAQGIQKGFFLSLRDRGYPPGM